MPLYFVIAVAGRITQLRKGNIARCQKGRVAR